MWKELLESHNSIRCYLGTLFYHSLYLILTPIEQGINLTLLRFDLSTPLLKVHIGPCTYTIILVTELKQVFGVSLVNTKFFLNLSRSTFINISIVNTNDTSCRQVNIAGTIILIFWTFLYNEFLPCIDHEYCGAAMPQILLPLNMNFNLGLNYVR